MKKLINGIIDFRKNRLEEYRNKFSKLALCQSPDALFVACCDSRVVPNVFASSDPGDLFVLRNIGNLIPTHCKCNTNCKSNLGLGIDTDTDTDISVSATIEFALVGLRVRDIIVCGHSNCGAMQALMDINNQNNHDNSDNLFLNKWIKYANSSYERFKNYNINKLNLSPCNLLSMVNVLQQLDNLKTYPLVSKRLQNNTLRIHGWWFDLETADVFYYNENEKDFILIN